MELLESSFVRHRQARYQAALRPDMKCVSDCKTVGNLCATPGGLHLRNMCREVLVFGWRFTGRVPRLRILGDRLCPVKLPRG